MEEQMYQLAQTGIYAGAAVLAVWGAVKIYSSARFRAANIKAKSEAEQARADKRKEVLESPVYLQLVEKRKETALMLGEGQNLEFIEGLEDLLNSICGSLP